MTAPLILVPHEPTNACAAVHCHSHHVDEPSLPAYVACNECGHVYRTSGELRAAYRRIVTQFTFPSREREDDPFGGLFDAPRSTGRARLLELWDWLLSRFARARDIHFCQECLHDF